MKKQDIQKLILESVREVVKEDNINLDEIDFGGMFKYTPPTDEQIDAYLRSRPAEKAIFDKDPERKAAFIKFVKTDKTAGKSLKNKEVIFKKWDPIKKEFIGQSGVAKVSMNEKEDTNEQWYLVTIGDTEDRSFEAKEKFITKDKNKYKANNKTIFVEPIKVK